MAQPDIILGEHNNLFVRHMVFKKAGDQEPAHTHQYDHETVLLTGRAMFSVEGRLIEQIAPCIVFIKAHATHHIIALEDNTQAACIHEVSKLKGNSFVGGDSLETPDAP